MQILILMKILHFFRQSTSKYMKIFIWRLALAILNSIHNSLRINKHTPVECSLHIRQIQYFHNNEFRYICKNVNISSCKLPLCKSIFSFQSLSENCRINFFYTIHPYTWRGCSVKIRILPLNDFAHIGLKLWP